jgi:ADP-L-glycero-D-manno-heptose 6-epimerase
MILVTGSEGFIGRNLVKKLFTENSDIFEFDAKHFEPMKLFGLIDFSKIKHIYHLGAISSTVEKDVQKLYEHNVQFSLKLFGEAIRWKIPVTYTSSASVYGNTMKDEKYDYNPLNYYALTKQLVEMWIADHFYEFVNIGIMRLFNVYGEDERKDDMSTSPIYRFTQQAKNDGYIKAFSNSHLASRDFVCVEDVLKSIEWVAARKKSGMYDVGTGMPITFLEVAQIISKKYDAPIKFIDMPSELKGKYQWYSSARPSIPMPFMSVEEWLESR